MSPECKLRLTSRRVETSLSLHSESFNGRPLSELLANERHLDLPQTLDVHRRARPGDTVSRCPRPAVRLYAILAGKERAETASKKHLATFGHVCRVSAGDAPNSVDIFVTKIICFLRAAENEAMDAYSDRCVTISVAE